VAPFSLNTRYSLYRLLPTKRPEPRTDGMADAATADILCPGDTGRAGPEQRGRTPAVSYPKASPCEGLLDISSPPRGDPAGPVA